MNKINGLKKRIRKIHILISIIILMSVLFLIGCSKSKVYRVGILSGLSLFAEITDGFTARMTELGYTEGKNILYSVEKTEFDMAAYERILEKFVEDKVDLIIVFPTEASQQAKIVSDGTGIPVVFVSAFTEGSGLVNSVKEPGGNMTGVRWPGPEIVSRGFEIAVELVPQIKRMIVCYTKDYPVVETQLEVIRMEASNAGITLTEIPASGTEDLEKELQKQTGPYDNAFINMIADPILVNSEGFSVAATFAAKNNIPMGGAPMFEGPYQSVYGLVPDSVSQGRQAAFLADKIFKGSQPGKLPVLTAHHILILNYMQAKKLDLNVSESLLGQADQVIR